MSESTDQKKSAKTDLQHFLKLAAAQIRHRIKQSETATEAQAKTTHRSLLLLEDLLNEQDQST